MYKEMMLSINLEGIRTNLLRGTIFLQCNRTCHVKYSDPHYDRFSVARQGDVGEQR